MPTRPKFQSTPPVKAATPIMLFHFNVNNISIHAAREGGDEDCRVWAWGLCISIHAAREGGDGYKIVKTEKGVISIHAAREGGDYVQMIRCNFKLKFQSTPPVKAATINIRPRRGICVFQSTPPVKAATSRPVRATRSRGISIHAAREGGDGFGFCPCRRAERFQSTPPVKAATYLHDVESANYDISIHAAREGGDLFSIFAFTGSKISIHAAREGGDCLGCIISPSNKDFNPRRP